MEIIDPRTLLVKIAAVLDELNIQYLITGGMAVAVWGRPRSTADIDAVIQLSDIQVDPLIQMLLTLSSAGYVDADVARDAIKRHSEFNFLDPLTGMKVDFWVPARGSQNAELFQRRRAEPIQGLRV